MRRTRIISTVGPASAAIERLTDLIQAGTDVFRLNFSHGTREAHRASCDRIRRAADAAGRSVAILQDLPGPKIRIGKLASPLELAPGGSLIIELDSGGGAVSSGPQATSSFAPLFDAAVPGARLLLDDGRIELDVVETSPVRITTRVVTGGRLESNKGINLPGVRLNTPAMTPKDADDLQAGIAMGVDAVAVSFVQSADDMRRAREVADAAGAPGLPLIAKIEKPEAVGDIEAILGASDGLMVARGDLGIEVPLETVPAIQKRLVQAARDHGVPAIVATQVLESMRESPRPTRAEVTDAAHAVDESADAVMLAGETAVGRYPVEAVRTLDRILRAAERERPAPPPLSQDVAGWTPHERALCEAAVALATRAGASAIVAVTQGGRTARLLSMLRPAARIVAAAPDPAVASRLNLLWGVTPIVAPPDVGHLRKLLTDTALLPHGVPVVFVSIVAGLTRQDANFVQVGLV